MATLQIQTIVMMKASKVKRQVPFHVKEELRRWNSHLEKHKKKMEEAKPTIDKKKMKSVEMLEQLRRNSDFQNRQRELAIQHNNQLLLKRLSKINGRNEAMSRNSRYYERRKSWDGNMGEKGTGEGIGRSATTNVMKSVREKEKKNIQEEKRRIESQVSAGHKKKNAKSEKVQKEQPSSESKGNARDVESIRPKVLPVKLEGKDKKKASTNKSSSSYVPPWKHKKSKTSEEKGGETKKKAAQLPQKDSKRKVKKKEEKKASSEGSKDDDDMTDQEIDQIIVQNADHEDEKENFHIGVTNKDEKEDDIDDVLNGFLKNVDNDEEDDDNDGNETTKEKRKSPSIPPVVIPTSTNDDGDDEDGNKDDETADGAVATERNDKDQSDTKQDDVATGGADSSGNHTEIKEKLVGEEEKVEKKEQGEDEDKIKTDEQLADKYDEDEDFEEDEKDVVKRKDSSTSDASSSSDSDSKNSDSDKD